MNEEKLYFAYGSNINLNQMDMRCPNARVIGPVVLEGYELLFRKSNRSPAQRVRVESEEQGSVRSFRQRRKRSRADFAASGDDCAQRGRNRAWSVVEHYAKL